MHQELCRLQWGSPMETHQQLYDGVVDYGPPNSA